MDINGRTQMPTYLDKCVATLSRIVVFPDTETLGILAGDCTPVEGSKVVRVEQLVDELLP